MARDETQLGMQEEELVRLLSDLGLENKPARVVAYLAARGHARSVDLEEVCGLRQPEVSQATKQLRDEYAWVVAEPQKTKGKGRPVNEYSLHVPLVDIVQELEQRKREEIQEDLQRLEKLRRIASQIEM